MAVEKQLSVFVQNKVGSLGELSENLAKASINIKAFSVVDDLDWGIVRLIVDDPDKAKEVLQKLGLMYGEGNVLTVELGNRPGALADLATKLAKKKINIEQAYATATEKGSLVVLSTTDDKKAHSLLSKTYE
ncbi:ACT domain-containing protein [candidate division KSB1 bacterium]|nr:ACT domain-containing protein [candidate division KSB1 bacterium]NIR71227.1 ACT domain-containing protein [candidate division KSB1 bacterium]NIS27601.1 ACT domain-containing protein [candidate division KSB1 bacterium]NIT72952.1 ACT domain-containing protein [candidate division KSB1 bacterium]NIU28317.1 ACT domain-containing protein [candidate division KSB1 bacterium]